MAAKLRFKSVQREVHDLREGPLPTIISNAVRQPLKLLFFFGCEPEDHLNPVRHLAPVAAISSLLVGAQGLGLQHLPLFACRCGGRHV